LGFVFLVSFLVIPFSVAEGQKEQSETEEEIVLDYVCWDDQRSTFKWFQDRFDEFEEMNPNVTVKVTGLPPADYTKVTMMNLATGSAPDLYPILSSQLSVVLDNGFLAPLDPWLQNSDLEERLLQVNYEVAERDGNLYALIRALPPWVLQVNMRLLKEAGYNEPPRNMEEFYEIAKGIKEETGEWGYVTWLDYSNDFNVMRCVLSWMIGFGGHWGLEPGKLTIDTEENAEAFTWLRKFVQDGIIPEGISESTSYDMFINEKIGMMIAGTWLPGMVQADNPEYFEDYLGVYKVPFPTKNSLCGGGWLGIPKDSDNKELAWELMEHMYSSESQRKWIEISTRLGATNDEPSDEWIKNKAPWFPVVLDVAQNHVNSIGYDPVGFEDVAGEFRKEMMPFIMELLKGDAPVEEILEDAQNDLDRWAEKKGK
jgi:multiple sugar transport system substrate-binding protein